MRFEVMVIDQNSQLISRKTYREWSTACYYVRDAINKGGYHACAWDLQQGRHGKIVYTITESDKVN